jgi:hypothetical protein
MKINCLSCGHKVDLDAAYDDYKGMIRCLACRAMLEIRTQEGQLRSVKPASILLPRSVEEAVGLAV